jgi:uncharacterized membrane protein YbhN (UPF0104 family)
VLRAVAIAVVGVSVVAFVLEQRSLLGASRDMRNPDRGWLAVAVLAMVALLANQAMFHAAAQRAAGVPTKPFGAVRPSLAATFMNQVTKSGGMAGLTMLVADGDRRRLGRAPVVAAYALVAVLTELAFAAALVAALLVGWLGGHLTGPELIGSVVFAVYLAARVLLIGIAATSRARLRRIYSLPRRVWASVRRTMPPEPDTRSADELYDALAILRGQPLRALPAAGHALAVEAIGVVELWAVIAAVGGGQSVLLALVAYAVSAMFAIVGVLPAGLGVAELSLAAVLISYGLPARTAVAAVVLYRVVELVIPVIVGAFVATRLREPVRAE